MVLVKRIWEEFKESRLGEQLELFERVLAHLSTGNPNNQLLEQAQTEAHRLAGTLGCYGLHVGIAEDITESLAIEKMKNEFISVVSHELRTPLAAIHGSLGLLAAGVLKDQPDTAQQMLEIAASDTERLVRLVNDILDLERLKANKVTLVKQWCDAAQLMKL